MEPCGCTKWNRGPCWQSGTKTTAGVWSSERRNSEANPQIYETLKSFRDAVRECHGRHSVKDRLTSNRASRVTCLLYINRPNAACRGKPRNSWDIDWDLWEISIVLYCIVSINLYSASRSAHQSEAFPVEGPEKKWSGSRKELGHR